MNAFTWAAVRTTAAGTLHTPNRPSTKDRILSSFAPEVPSYTDTSVIVVVGFVSMIPVKSSLMLPLTIPVAVSTVRLPEAVKVEAVATGTTCAPSKEANLMTVLLSGDSLPLHETSDSVPISTAIGHKVDRARVIYILCIAAFTASGVIGKFRSRAPVAAKTAFATAGATGGTPGSPMPPSGCLLTT